VPSGYESGYGYCLCPYGPAYRSALRTTRITHYPDPDPHRGVGPSLEEQEERIGVAAPRGQRQERQAPLPSGYESGYGYCLYPYGTVSLEPTVAPYALPGSGSLPWGRPQLRGEAGAARRGRVE